MKRLGVTTFCLIGILLIGNGCTYWYDRMMKSRLETLGREIFLYAKAGNYDRKALPEDLVFIGNNTFWNILRIPESIDSIDIIAHLPDATEQEASYILDIGTYIGLRMKYDVSLNKFHILGYSAAKSKEEEAFSKKLSLLDEYVHTLGEIQPEVGMKSIQVNETNRTELFKDFEELFFNRLGLYFNFSDDHLKQLYISSYQFQTKEGIRPQTGVKQEIIDAYGTPQSTRDTFSFLDITVQPVEVLEYDGISFILLKGELMLIEIN